MRKLFVHLLLTMFLANCMQTVIAQAKELYVLEKKIALPGDGGYDYSFVDELNRRLYVSHATVVHVIDLNTDEAIGSIEGMQGVHGIAIVTKIGKGFITDGKLNAVHVFDLQTLRIVQTIAVGGKKTDAIMYDTYSNQVFAFNNGSDNVSVIDVDSLKEKKLLGLGGAPEFGVSDGKGLIYNNLEDKNYTVIIDAKKMKVLDSISVAPNGTPTALAFDAKNKRLFSGCREGSALAVIDVVTRKVITTVPICKAVDAVVYDAEQKLIFCAGDGTTTIIQQKTANEYVVVQTLTTGVRAKTMSLDKKSHKIYISVADYEAGTKKIISGTFRLLVYKLNG